MLREGRAAPYVGSTAESSIITAPMTSANQATAQATFLPFSSGGGVWEDGPSIAASPPSRPASGRAPLSSANYVSNERSENALVSLSQNFGELPFHAIG